jgi:type 1 glutamine amidotransferase
MSFRATTLILLVAVGCGGGGDGGPDSAEARDAVLDGSCTGSGGPRVLVFTRENLWMHPSTPVASAALLAMCEARGFSVTASHDEKVFDSFRLAQFDVVVFAVTSGIVLDDPGRLAFEAWVRGGGGVVGLHSASATELEWPFFIELMGAQFLGHPPGLFAADITVEDSTHPTVAGLPPRWNRTDEWYYFVQRPEEQAGLHILLALDEASAVPDLPADARVGFHAVTWTHERFGGRSFYTAMGHTSEAYAEPAFLDMVAAAIAWTAGD